MEIVAIYNTRFYHFWQRCNLCFMLSLPCLLFSHDSQVTCLGLYCVALQILLVGGKCRIPLKGLDQSVILSLHERNEF